MKNLVIILILSLPELFLAGCNSRQQTNHIANTRDDNKAADTAFARIADEFLDGYLASCPQIGTSLGLHQYDGKLPNYSKASLEEELARLKRYDQQFAAMDTTRLNQQQFMDYRLIRAAIGKEIFNFEELRPYTANPMTYAGVLDLNIYVQRDFASLEDRMRSIIAMEEMAPDIFAAASENLADSLAKPYIETAMQIARGSADFLEKELAKALQSVRNDSLVTAFAVSNQKAITELKGYATFLEKEKLPKTHNRYAIGKENYRKMLLYNEMLDMTSEQVLKLGMAELKREQAAFAEVARKIDPNRKPLEVLASLKKEHPTAENLIPDAKKNLEAIRQFLVDKKILTVPSDVRVQVQETPQYARATSTASMDTPGPFEKKATQAFYYITPVEKTWTPKQAEEWLSQFNYYVTDIISIHEAYPGHYVQFLHLNASPATKVQKVFGSYAFVEGWAHYTEKMMIEQGYGADKDSLTAAKYHLAQLNESLLRLCRLCVSVKTHCEGMTLPDATKFFQDNCYYEYKPAYQEALRGTFDPGYLSYTLGKLQILQLREDYKKQEGTNFSLQKFHDTLLDNGMPPLQLIRERMIKNGEKSQGLVQ
jgi:uncharacterized protein (DUF885 family)